MARKRNDKSRVQELSASLLRHLAPLPYVGPRVHTRIAPLVAAHLHSWSEVLERVEGVADQFAEVSVDIFDSVLSRRLIGQPAILRAVAVRLVRDGIFAGSVDEYLAARSIAERGSGGTLHAWYSHEALAAISDPDDAIRAEAEVELSLTDPMPGAVEGLAQLRARFGSVTLLSDMYLPHETLSMVLEAHGCLADDDRLVISGEEGATKNSGELYLRIWPEASDRRELLHIGNDIWGDGARAAAAEITPIQLDVANPSRYEIAMSEHNHEAAGPAIAAAARRVRLHQQSDVERDLISWGASLLGQLMTAFALWVRDEAGREGITTLSFLARDGELPLRVAAAMPADHFDGIDLRYLHSSRKAWSLAAASVVGVERWLDVGLDGPEGFLNHRSGETPLGARLERAGLTIDDLRHLESFARLDPDISVSSDLDLEIHHALRLPEIMDQIRSRSAEQRDLIVDHLRATYPEAGALGLVDVGWRGQQAWIVSVLVERALGEAPINFHFGGHGVTRAMDELVTVRRFALDDSVEPHPIDHPVSCLELLLGSGKPSLVGYDRAGDGSVSERFASSATPVATSSLDRIWEGAVGTATELPSAEILEGWGVTNHALIRETRELLSLFWNTPTAAEVELLRELRYEHDDAGREIGPAILPYSPAEMFGGAPHARLWRQGSLQATPALLRYAAQAALAAKDRRR